MSTRQRGGRAMANLADLANDLVEERMERALATRDALKAEMVCHSFLYCETCDAPIPLARRIALEGCTQCVSCQNYDEVRRAHNA
ncbi:MULTISPECIES: TraR/DksA family transcriptional regulator [Pseudomonas]|jgi:phage/conjugal plasmid C-4 type zinc finger TraR family protein